MHSKKIGAHVLAICLCLIPIFDPYILGTIGSFDIGVVDAVLTLIAIGFVWRRKSVPCLKSFFGFGLVLFVLNLLSFTTRLHGSFTTSIRVWIFWAFYCVIFSASVEQVDFKQIENWVMRIATVVCVFMLIQFVCVLLQIPVWNGKIPFIQLGKYEGWSAMADVTGAIRVHSFFQEPSYLGVYLLPVVSRSLQNKKIIPAILFIICIILSTSTLAIVALGIALAWHIVCEVLQEKSWKSIKFYLYGFLAVVLLTVIGCCFIPQLKKLVIYTVTKITKIFADLSNPRMGSTRLRLLGNIFLFAQYPFMNKLVGVGINQYSVVFSEQIQYAYSNSVVTMILNSGLVGAICFVALICIWIKKCSVRNKIYPILFLITMCTDQMLFNWYFFYMVMWTLFALHDSKKPEGVLLVNIESINCGLRSFWERIKTINKK